MYCFLASISFFFKTSWEDCFKSRTAVRRLHFVPLDITYCSKDSIAELWIATQATAESALLSGCIISNGTQEYNESNFLCDHKFS